MRYQLLADAVLTLHVGVVVFVIGSLVLIVAGNLRGWPWVNRRWFRAAHLAAIGYVVAEAWLGLVCPLTALELWLRRQAGAGSTYAGGFVEHWLQRLLYYDAPPWVFVVGYSAFGLAVAWVWWRFPPARSTPRPVNHVPKPPDRRRDDRYRDHAEAPGAAVSGPDGREAGGAHARASGR